MMITLEEAIETLVRRHGLVLTEGGTLEAYHEAVNAAKRLAAQVGMPVEDLIGLVQAVSE
jgi:hypothetical protein